MRFPCVFYRQYSTSGGNANLTPNPVLGSDSAPSPLAVSATAVNPPTPELAAGSDNVLSVPNVSSQAGFPQRIAVLYGYVGAGSAPALTASLYFLEETTGLWFLVGTKSTALVKGGITFFDALSISQGPVFGGGAYPGQTPDQTLGKGQPSSGRYALIVDLVGTVVGQYYFAMAPVLTASP